MLSSIVYPLVGLLAFQPASALDLISLTHDVRLQHFDSFHRFAQFVAASIPVENCPYPPLGSHVIGEINEMSTTTQARVFVDDFAKEIIFAAPGTAQKEDYRIDANYTQVPYVSSGVKCEACYVHGGFLDAWNSISDQAHGIMRAAHKSYPDYRMITTGHSLGGAVAALAWSSFQGSDIPVHAAYTFGQPRIGNKAFANYIDKLSGADEKNLGNFYRITHAADPVPNMPGLHKDNWVHAKTQFWESGKYFQEVQSTFRCYEQEPPNCSNGQQKHPDVNDHMLYSNVHFADAYSYCGL